MMPICLAMGNLQSAADFFSLAEVSANNLQNYLTSLKEKGVLVPYEDKFLLAPLLVPDTQLTFNFLVQDEDIR